MGAARGKEAAVVARKVIVHVRSQQGHSFLFHLLLCAVGIGFITIPYYTLSSKHYWHL